MNILIMHRIAYHKINHHLSIDHNLHNVTYIGLEKYLQDLPELIRHKAIIRPGLGGVADEVLAAIREQNVNVDLLVSMSESEALDAAKVRDLLGIPGSRVNDVLKLRDKLEMKRLVERHGIQIPRAMSLAEFKCTMQIGWLGKTLLKPVDDASGVDMKIFDSPEVLRQALRFRKTGIARLDLPDQPLDQFDVEECISGELMHFDGLVKKGRVMAVIGSTYIGNSISYAEGQSLGSVQVDISEEDENWVQRILHAINLENGVFHLEAIHSKSGNQFLEIANRPGGASVVETFRLATGVNLITAELRILMGEKIVIKQRKKSRRFGWFVFPGHHLAAGTCDITGHESYLQHPALIKYDMLNKTSTLPRKLTYQSKVVPLAGIISGSSSEEMGNWLRRMFRDVKIISPSDESESNPDSE